MRATLDGTLTETQLRAVRKASGVIVGKPMGGLLDKVWKLAERGLLPSAEGRMVPVWFRKRRQRKKVYLSAEVKTASVLRKMRRYDTLALVSRKVYTFS